MIILRPLPVLVAALACTHLSAQTAGTPTSTAESNAAVFKACAAAPVSKGACPLDSVFGLFTLGPNNEVLDFKASRTVPRVVDQNYGWILKLNQKTGKVRVLERMTLPRKPESWGAGGEPYGMSADGRTISLDVTLTVHDGTVSKSWDVARGDPAGHYLITAYVENSPPVQFEFDVVR